MQSYLQRLAQVFVQEVGNELPEYTFVFPNHRAGLFFRRYLGQMLSRPIFSPRVMTINDCFASLSQLRVTDQLTLVVRLYNFYQQLHPQPEAIEKFLHWGKMMLADFSEVDNHMVKDIEALYTAVEDIHDIDIHFQSLSDNQRDAIKKFWGDFYASSDKKHNSLHQQFVSTWQLLYPLYQALTQDLLKDQLAYEGLLHRHVLEHWDQIPESAFEKHYVFIGFNALTESERQLLLHLRDRGCADFYFDYEGSYLSDPNNRASLFMQNNLHTFTSHYTIPPQSESTTPHITHISVDSTIGEARQVHDILSQLYPKGTPLSADFTRTAVVLPDEQLLVPLLDCFPEGVKKINVTMGYPLRASELYMPIAYPERYFNPTPATSIDMIKAFRNYWDKHQHAANSEAHYLLTKALNQIEETIAKFPNILFSADAVVQILRMLTMQSTIPYAGEPLNGLQVMGVLETRALDFDNLIITDFNDELYPGRRHSNSFIPYILRRGFGLPTPERQDAIFAYNFYRMLSYAQHIWFITNAITNDQHSGEVSRYLYQLQWQYGVNIEHISVVSPLSTPTKKAPEISKDEHIQERIRRFLQRGISASAINKYLSCQKQFCYHYVLNIRPQQQDTDYIVSDATLGTVLHAIMEELYEPYKNCIVTPDDIQSIMDSLTEERWQRLPINQVRNDCLALYVVKKYVQNILQYDQKQAPFTYLHSEQKVERKLHIPALGDIPFYGYIDRVDKQREFLRIIDYKTGSAQTEYTNMQHIFQREKNQSQALQTMLYCWMLRHSMPQYISDDSLIAPHIYHARAMAKTDKIQTLIHKTGDSQFVFDDATEQEFLQHLSDLMLEICNPDTPFQATENHELCKHCPHHALCKG